MSDFNEYKNMKISDINLSGMTLAGQLQYLTGLKSFKINEMNTSTFVFSNENIDIRANEIKELTELIEKIKKEIDSGDSLEQDGELYLSDVINIEKPKFNSNNLIIAPVGSGKSTLIENNLMKNIKGTCLMLVSNTHLKESLVSTNEEERKLKADRTFTTNKKAIYGEGDSERLVMTYAEFGKRLLDKDKYLNNIKHIYCDEIHSLPEYETYGKSWELIHAIQYLFEKQEGKKIFYFTATDESLILLKDKYKMIMSEIKIFDYRDYPNIKKYTSLEIEKINHFRQIRNILIERNYKEDFLKYGYKGLIFTKLINTMKTLEEMLIEEGFTPLVLWSVNNKDNPMSEEQLKARDELMKTEKIPKPYNFLIINGAMREGWNLKDNKVQLAIMNTISETDQIQARGRIRSNIAKLIIKDEKELNTDSREIEVKEKFLNRPLDKNDKEELCIDLNIVDNRGILVKWERVKKILINNDYVVDDKTITIKKKRTRISVVSIEDENED